MMADDIDLTEEFQPIVPAPRCPHCGKTVDLDLRTYGFYSGPVKCPHCPITFEVSFSGRRVKLPGLMGFEWGIADDDLGGILQSPPKPIGDAALLAGITSPPIHPEIQKEYEDGVMSLATAIPRGAAMLARYAIQQALLSNGIPDKQPIDMVHIAHARKLLSGMAKNQCEAVVFIGGKAAHPQDDVLASVTEADAKQGLFAARRVLLELFNPSAVAG